MFFLNGRLVFLTVQFHHLPKGIFVFSSFSSCVCGVLLGFPLENCVYGLDNIDSWERCLLLHNPIENTPISISVSVNFELTHNQGVICCSCREIVVYPI